MSEPLGIGVIGAGVISDIYLQNLTAFPDLDVKIVGDLVPERARERAEAHGDLAWGSADDVLSHAGVDIVVNLTIPAAHVDVSTAAVAAGKHVWTEKPLGLDRLRTRALLDQADAAGVRIGCAPDTVLGPGVQTAKRAIAAGVIGRPLFAQTAMQWQGPELFHPDPAFLFAAGAGPLLDMGPYYISALVSVLGPVRTVAAMGMQGRATRTIEVGPNAGATFDVEVPTTISVLTAFEGGQRAQSMLSFDSPLARQGEIEIHGTEGSIVIPDPNRFEGRTAYVRPLDAATDGGEVEQPWIEIPQQGIVVDRGLGVLEMARAIRAGRPHLATGELGYHVLDVLLSAEESARDGRFVEIESSVHAVAAMPGDFDPFASTL